MTLTAATADGAGKLPPFDPKKTWQLPAAPGVGFALGVTVKPGLALKNVEYFAEDVKVGDGKDGTWELAWPAPPGTRAVFARWETADGTVGVTNPALLTAR